MNSTIPKIDKNIVFAITIFQIVPAINSLSINITKYLEGNIIGIYWKNLGIEFVGNIKPESISTGKNPNNNAIWLAKNWFLKTDEINSPVPNAVNRNKIKRIIRESYYREMKKIKQGYNIVFLWNKKEPIENICFQEVHKEIVEIFKEADLFEKN